MNPVAAVILAPTLRLVTLVVMVNGADVVTPAAIGSDEGNCVKVELLDNVTTIPPGGAGPLRVTVLLLVATPPGACDGERVSAEIPTGEILSMLVRVVVPYFAVTVNVVAAVTTFVTMVNGAETAPGATVTVAGTVV